MKKTILLATCTLATLSAAAVDVIDRAAEVAVLGRIERAVNDAMIGMREQATGVAGEIRVEIDKRFEGERRAIEAERGDVCTALEGLCIEMGDLDKYELFRRIRVDFEKREEVELAPLLAGLQAVRAPVMDQVRELARERDEIERIHYENKRRYPGLMDGLDSRDVGMSMAAKNKEIRDIYASVDGTLHKQIAERREALSKEREVVLRDTEEKAEARRQVLKVIIDDLTRREEGLVGRLREIARAAEHAVDAAMPGKHEMFAGIRQELLLRVISGGADPESLALAAAAA